jgi:hypothetical protein
MISTGGKHINADKERSKQNNKDNNNNSNININNKGKAILVTGRAGP